MTLQFEPWSSAVDATFWFELSRKKLNELRLDDSSLSVKGYYVPGFLIKNGMTSPSRLFVTSESFYSEPSYPKHHLACPGTLKNVNILNEFKSIDKIKYLNDQGRLIWEAIESGQAIESPETLIHFSLLTYSDLKSNKFYYWFAFPALILPEPAILIQSTPLSTLLTENQLATLSQSMKSQSRYSPFFAIQMIHDSPTVIPIMNYNPQDPSHFPALIDSSGLDDNPGWHLRNFLYLLKRRFGLNRVKIYCLREDVLARSSGKAMASSIVLDIELPGFLTNKIPDVTGWEPNASGKLGPRVTDLSSMMDPKLLAENAVDLNLKLMKWRILPDLALEKISPLRCLLFGAGTLGTNVARSLMGWGIRHVTFVDNGHVSYSNPVRQSLYSFEDCVGEGNYKATVAADALKTIFPSMVSTGHVLTIPMPGHHVDSIEKNAKTIEMLESLVNDHDVLFLLTDSREARWLPTLLGAAKDKIVINAALGFDTFLVMRHGMRTSDPRNPGLGCYFCNDVVAPTNSMADRTLDQMCTVSRPGLSAIASAMAVELLVSVMTHPDGPYAPAHVTLNPSQSIPSDASILGLVPHQIRGYLSHFSQSLIVGQAYNQCVACSPVILNSYNQEKTQFILKALSQPDYLEEVTGLKKLQAETLDLDFDDDF